MMHSSGNGYSLWAGCGRGNENYREQTVYELPSAGDVIVVNEVINECNRGYYLFDGKAKEGKFTKRCLCKVVSVSSNSRAIIVQEKKPTGITINVIQKRELQNGILTFVRVQEKFFDKAVTYEMLDISGEEVQGALISEQKALGKIVFN